jgi:Zn-dependent protease with chaperone function
MGFFERQDDARRRSSLLLFLFLVAMLAVVAALDAAAMLIWYFFQLYIDRPLQHMPRWLHYTVIGMGSATMIFISLRKTIQVHGEGGLGVARMLGARQVVPLKATPLEHRLLNIVHEMSIASGIRAPIVYVMDEHGGINAFAAGFDHQLCVLVVTRGALERLNRDELQGVVGHEFSHIVNGDMAFNLQLIGVLAGLSFMGAAGEYLLRTGSKAARAEFRVAAAMIMAGAFLFAIGYSGLAAAQLIKAMIARQREYGADFGSVQFTRNPEGLAGALDQVRRNHSTVLHARSEEVSHLFFAEAIYLNEERLLATHPPLDERIERLAPGFAASQYRDRRIDPLTGLGEQPMTMPF